MSYLTYTFKCAEAQTELLIGWFSLLPFEAFEETETGFTAYLSMEEDLELVERELADYSTQFPFTFVKEELEDRNWNAEWEANFEPVEVGNFCRIRAIFHEPAAGFQHELVIQPEMAFGTGHHETTHMMIQLMQNGAFKDTSVFDYGAGTAVLAILAEQLGATYVDAVDIEKPAYESIVRNAQINKAQHIHAFFGDLTVVPERKYDWILANINRNVLLLSMSTFPNRLSPNGKLLLSGILEQDLELITESAAKNGLVVQRQLQRGKWMALHLEVQ